MNDQERVTRGLRAFEELQEVQAAFQAVEKAVVDELLATSPLNETKILTLHRAAQAVEAVRVAMRHVIEDGEMARHAIATAGLTRPN